MFVPHIMGVLKSSAIHFHFCYQNIKRAEIALKTHNCRLLILAIKFCLMPDSNHFCTNDSLHSWLATLPSCHDDPAYQAVCRKNGCLYLFFDWQYVLVLRLWGAGRFFVTCTLTGGFGRNVRFLGGVWGMSFYKLFALIAAECLTICFNHILNDCRKFF